MKDTKIDSTRLYVACVRAITQNDGESLVMKKYNNIGYRVFYKKNEKEYVDIVTKKTYPAFNDSLKLGTLFVLNPEPFFHYAHSIRVREELSDVKKYAEYANDFFNKNPKNKSKWIEVKDYVHAVHHAQKSYEKDM